LGEGGANLQKKKGKRGKPDEKIEDWRITNFNTTRKVRDTNFEKQEDKKKNRNEKDAFIGGEKMM